jgi:hypothetical protein
VPAVPSPNISVVERFVLGFLDPASGLSEDTLGRLREETQDLVDDARSTPLEFEDLAVEGLVKDAVLVGVVDVLEECGADEWTRSRAGDIDRIGRVTGARAAAQELRRIHAEVETVIEKAACHHAAQSCDALADSPVPNSATQEAYSASEPSSSSSSSGMSVRSLGRTRTTALAALLMMRAGMLSSRMLRSVSLSSVPPGSLPCPSWPMLVRPRT